jgi:8-oxo-dGTP pyrophosphatase MutT (NUDIX family)
MRTKECDHTSVGVVIRTREGKFALLKRARFPIGISPPAGHIDDHGTVEQAAEDEVFEELGLAVSGLKRTSIFGRRVSNQCRRPGGDYHRWYVFEAIVDNTELRPSEDETKGAAWYSHTELQTLADRTQAYRAGEVSEADWAEDPGLEEVWVPFLQELGYIASKN